MSSGFSELEKEASSDGNRYFPRYATRSDQVLNSTEWAGGFPARQFYAAKRMKKNDIKKVLAAIVGSAFCFVALVTLTTSHAVHSEEIELADGSKLQVKDIRKNNIPFTGIWLRRNIELIQTDAQRHERVIFRGKLPARDAPSQWRLKMKSETEVLLFLNDQEPIGVALNGTG